MPSISESSTSTSRSSTFSIGNSPLTAGLRIHSFIDRRWKVLPDIQDLGQSLCGYDTITEQEFGASSLKGIPHHHFSSAGPRHFSTILSDQDIGFQDQGFETPVVETARVQIQKIAPARNLVYVPKADARYKAIGNSTRSAPRCDGDTKETQVASTLSDVSTVEVDLQKLIPAPLCSRTAYFSHKQYPGTCSVNSVDGHRFPSPPKTPTNAIRHGQTRKPKRCRPHCKRAHVNLQQPQRREVWPCRFSRTRVSKIVPPIPARVSRLNADHSFALDDAWKEDDFFRKSANDVILHQRLTGSSTMGLGSPIYLAPEPSYSARSGSGIQMDGDNGHIFPDTYTATTVSGHSVDCPVDDSVVSNDTTLCEPWGSVETQEESLPKSRLMEWWGRCFQRGRISKR